MIKKIALLFCAVSLPLLGDSLVGEYGVTGFDPHKMEPYRGVAKIKEKKGNIYDITWHIKPRETLTGTGIKEGDELVVVFKNNKDLPDVGLHTYKIYGNTLSGKWIYLGRDKKGSETLKRMD